MTAGLSHISSIEGHGFKRRDIHPFQATHIDGEGGRAIRHLAPREGQSLPLDRAGCVFGQRGTGFMGWAKSKIELDAKLPGIKQRWTLHDIRRTAATRMGDLGVQPHIIEAVLNHISGHRAGGSCLHLLTL